MSALEILGAAALLLVPAIIGCAESSEQTWIAAPARDDFAPLSLALGARCGSLDCHGRVERNLRLYSKHGLRWSVDDVPAGDDTTFEEHDANYESVVLLEPEQLERVWRAAGAGSDGLTLVRKARGQEAHKGGAVFPSAQAGDRCLLSWLSGALDRLACEEVAEPPLSPFAE